MWNESERRTTLYIFTNLKGLARYFGRVMPIEVIQEEVKSATRVFRTREHSSASQTQLEFLKLCETRLVHKARELQVEI
jgi:hypothetical protein